MFCFLFRSLQIFNISFQLFSYHKLDTVEKNKKEIQSPKKNSQQLERNQKNLQSFENIIDFEPRNETFQ